MPEVVARVNALIEDPEAGPSEVGACVAGDLSIAARVLAIANSAHYGLWEPADSVQRAVTTLGLRSVKNIVLQAVLIREYQHLSRYQGFDLRGLWKHAILTGQLCQQLASASSVQGLWSADAFYTCGLLHDLGRVVLLDSLGEEYLDVIGLATSIEEPLHVVEKRVLGVEHASLGGAIARQWGSGALVSAIEQHHRPLEELLASPASALVACADQLAHSVADRSVVPIECGSATVQEALGLCLADLTSALEYGLEAWPLIEV